MTKDVITMSKKEFERLSIIHKVINKRITQLKAAEMIGIGDRQIRRIVKKVELHGDTAIIHGNRGCESPRKIPVKKIDEITRIIKKRYHDFGPLFASEKLFECHDIKISKEKLRQIMIEADIWTPKKESSKTIHQWRERRHHWGEMPQMDGSTHDWFEGRGPKCTLMAYVDDATSSLFARFYDFEGTFSAMDSLRRYINLHGLPQSIYFDRHSTYKTTRQPNQDEALKDEYAKTQFGRSLKELEIKPIFALSPQAKGRIERNFKTLQDRLVKELRLANVSSIEEANLFLETYLPKYNAKFARDPLNKENFHKPLPKNIDLDNIFCLKEFRSIGRDYSFRWKNRIFVLNNPSITLKKQRICVMEQFNGKISAKFKDKLLDIMEVTQSDLQAIAKVQKATQKFIKKQRVYFKPPKNHPWRNFTLGHNVPAYA